jgi:hypothetical protein
VNRDKYKSGEEAWEAMNKKKAIANMIWNLKRVRAVKIKRWVWVLEWHEDGFPHWHVLIETENKGMIGGDFIREYWGMGLWIKESYFKSKEHWNSVVGYFEKKGYFEKGKKYQSELPAWARVTNLRIRRFSGSVEKENKIEDEKFYEVEKNREGVKKMDADQKELKIYEVRFQECGAYTVVSIDSPFFGIGYLVNLPFQDFNKFMGGRYEPGMGFVVTMNDDEVETLIDLCETYQKIKGQNNEKKEGEGVTK